MIIHIILFSLVGILSFRLFKQAAGTLALGKLNIISYIYYLFMVQLFVGTVLVNLGYDRHYTLNKLIFREDSIAMTTNVVCFAFLALPLVMLIVFRCFKFNAKSEYNIFLDRQIYVGHKDKMLILFTIIIVIQLVLLFILIKQIGYIPLLKLFVHDSGFDFALERIRIQGITILGNEYIKNIIISIGIPIISYFTLSYALATKDKYWVILAILTFLSSIVVKTYDFSKSPLLFHFFVFLLIVIYYKKGIKNSIVVAFGVVMALLLISYYKIMGYAGSLFDIYNGILGRTFFTQYGTLCFHFDLFPSIFDYLNGRSLNPTLLSFLGMDPETHLRSARIVMDFYGSKSVYEGTAGVMNAAFMGEAYANYGIFGVVGSTIWVGIVISIIFILLMRIKKTPITIALLAFLTQFIGNMTQGGFVDFIYNSSLIIVMSGSLFLIYVDVIYAKLRGHRDNHDI